VPKTGLGVIVMVNAPNTAGGIAETLLRLMSSALKEAKDSNSDTLALPDFTDFTGVYSAQPWGSETAVVQWMDQLAVMPLNATAGPVAEKLQLVGGNAFRVVRPNDEGLGETIAFQRDSSGNVVSLTRHGQINLKLSSSYAVPKRPVVPLATPPPGDGAGTPVTTTTVRHSDGTTAVIRTSSSVGGGAKL
jgi:hypothetical protein